MYISIYLSDNSIDLFEAKINCSIAETEIYFLSLWQKTPKKHLLQIQQYLHNHSHEFYILELFNEFLVKYSIYRSTKYIRRQMKTK